METLTLAVPGISCDHCRRAIEAEVAPVEGVAEVEVDVPARRVVVRGASLDEAAIRAAIDEAGYDVP